MVTEMYIEGQPADVNTALASLLTYAIDDIKDFSSRQTTFSKTVVLPGTARNNQLLGNIFEVSTSNDYDPNMSNSGLNFNPSVSATCLVFQDFVQTFKGTVRLLEIVIDRGRVEYEVALTGELALLNVALSSKLLEDLDFSAYDHAYTADNIIASWGNNKGAGYYYPLIDYGKYSTDKKHWQYGTFRPALYVKEYLDKMFTAASFRYQCDLFNTNRFKGLIVPHNQKALTVPVSQVLRAGRVAPSQMVIDYGQYNTNSLVFNSYSGSLFTVSNSGSITYNGTDTLNLALKMTLNFQYKTTMNTIRLDLFKNNTIIATKTLGNTGGMLVTSNYWLLDNLNITMATGDKLRVDATVSDSSQGHQYTFSLVDSPGLTLTTSSAIPAPILPGDTTSLNTAIPKNIKQIDFLTSIVKLFNLYVWEDKFDERLIHIAPYVDFYSTSSQNSVDWTYKLDRSQPIRHTPMSEINAKTFVFKYKDDSDYYNDLYKKRYNLTYGTHSHDTQFEFVQQTQTVELLFAATPLVGYAGEAKVYPTIMKINNGAEDQMDSVIRILQTHVVTGVPSWNILSGTTVLRSTTSYGYAGHFDNPNAVTNDLNFGEAEELFFVLVAGDITVNQFNMYWSPYMTEITDKDSKLLTGKFRLTPKDVLDLDFSKYVYVDGTLFRLNKITDYNLTKPDTCEVRLLKVINTLY